MQDIQHFRVKSLTVFRMSFASTFRSAAKDFLRLTITTTPTAQTAWQTPEMPRSPCPQRSSPATRPANSDWGIRWADGLGAAACGCRKKARVVECSASCSGEDGRWNKVLGSTASMFRTVAREVFCGEQGPVHTCQGPQCSPARQYLVTSSQSQPAQNCSVLCHRSLVVLILRLDSEPLPQKSAELFFGASRSCRCQLGWLRSRRHG